MNRLNDGTFPWMTLQANCKVEGVITLFPSVIARENVSKSPTAYKSALVVGQVANWEV